MKNLLLLILLVLLLFSCVTYKTVTEPVGENYFFEQGRKYMVSGSTEAEITICLEETTGNEMKFFLQIKNLNDDTLTVDPADFYCHLNKCDFDNEQERIKNLSYCINPETRINTLENQLIKREESYSQNQLANTACGLSSCAIGGASYISGDKETGDGAIDEMARVTERMERERIEYENDVSKFNSEKNYWSNEAFRKTTLNGNSTYAGFVHFNVKSSSKFFLLFPVKNSVILFEYNQKRIKI